MSKQKKALGKGIRALLSGIDEDDTQQENLAEAKEAVDKTRIVEISLESIEINPFQPRADFNEDGLRDLAQSITVHGVIQPVTVRSLGGDKYQLIAGERRLRASKMAGKEVIPAFIRKADDQEMLEIALIENIQREDLNAIEIAINYKRLIDECDLTQEQMGGRLGKNRSTVTNYLRLLRLPPDIQTGIRDKVISMGHARTIVNIDDADVQLAAYNEIVSKGLSVRKTEAFTKKLKEGKSLTKSNTNQELPLAYRKIQDNLSSLLGTKVRLNVKKGGKGEIVVSYFSDEDLDRIIELLAQDE